MKDIGFLPHICADAVAAAFAIAVYCVQLGLRTDAVLMGYGTHNTATATVPWPSRQSTLQYGYSMTLDHMCRRHTVVFGRSRPYGYRC
jgi:hypothetical protein